MSAEQIDPRQLALAELVESAMPTVDDILADIGPFGRLLFCQLAIDETLRLWLAMLSADEEETTGLDDERAEALNALVLANGNIIAACIAVGVMDAAAAPPAL